MDEITYWIYTKRAPCLMGYDRAVNAQIRSKTNVITKPSPKPCPVPSPERKRKRKLSILDDESDIVEKKQNVYFEDNQQIKRQVGSCKTLSDSDVNFNIKNSPKPHKVNLLRNGKIASKKKPVTSTPICKAGVRRSSRKFVLKASALNESPNGFNQDNTEQVHGTKLKLDNAQACVDKVVCNGEDKANAGTRAHERVTLQFDDVSDVSGFTANYIRSTKVHANKSRGNINNKRNRIDQKGTKNVTTSTGNIVNKTVSGNTELDNTGLSEMVNNNTSHNVTKEVQTSKTKTNNKKRETAKVNITMTTVDSGASRYPIRNKRRKLNDSSDTLDKDMSSVRAVSRTRSGRYIGTMCTDSESPEKVDTSRGKKRSSWARTVECAKKLINNKSVQSVNKESVRSKSGFAECFSESDEDSQPPNKGKYFVV